MRTEAREAALKILYAGAINPTEVDAARKSVFKHLSEAEFDFATSLLSEIEANEEQITAVIGRNIQNFKENRLFPIDRAVLMIAVAEMLYFPDIPPVISISEATDMAQKYSTETSADFVNGVLSGVMKECTK